MLDDAVAVDCRAKSLCNSGELGGSLAYDVVGVSLRFDVLRTRLSNGDSESPIMLGKTIKLPSTSLHTLLHYLLNTNSSTRCLCYSGTGSNSRMSRCPRYNNLGAASAGSLNCQRVLCHLFRCPTSSVSVVQQQQQKKKDLLFTLPRHLCLNLGPFRKLSISLSPIPALVKVLFFDRVED